MNFITLTNEHGLKIRYNAAHIISYWPRNGKTEIKTTSGFEKVDESSEQIDNLLKELGA